MADFDILLSPAHVGEVEFSYLKEAFDSNWISPTGPFLQRLEQAFAHRVGTPEAVALASGTAGIHLALLLCGVSPGDEVFCSNLTFIGSVGPVVHLGAKPVFIDCQKADWNMDPKLLAEALDQAAHRNKLPKAVIVVHLFGQCADMDPILAACHRYDVPVIEDAAESLGALYKGRPSGSMGKFGVFSLNGNKIITCGGGGVLTGHDPSLLDRARYLSTQAREKLPYYEHKTAGYNFRLSNILAAIGLGQMESLDKKIALRYCNYLSYNEAFAKEPAISMIPILEGSQPNYWLSCAMFDHDDFGLTAEKICEEVSRQRIEVRRIWKPMHLQPVFKDCRVVGGRVSEQIFAQGLCLPSGSAMTDDQRNRVVSAILGTKPQTKKNTE